MRLDFKILSFGDAAASIDFGNSISEEVNGKIIAMRDWMRENPFEGLKDKIIAYSSLTLYYDPITIRKKYEIKKTVYDFVHQYLEKAFHESKETTAVENKIVRIPVCYDPCFATDMDYLVESKNITREEVIHLHVSKLYRVYMIGFLPGFSYMGKMDDRLQIPRKRTPVMVEAGSVGIAGAQTGIYPLNCPGGWQILGRTPLSIFNPKEEEPVSLNIGNHVLFYEISKEEFVDFSAKNTN